APASRPVLAATQSRIAFRPIRAEEADLQNHDAAPIPRRRVGSARPAQSKVAPREAAKRPAPNDELLKKKIDDILANYENEAPAPKVARVSAQVGPRYPAPGLVSQGYGSWKEPTMTFVRDSRKNKYRNKPEELQQVQPAAAGR
ncbi:hypothetical protein PFISCL1PPCAC_647, partial [Pristionchus fissidentatus]